MNNNRRKEIKQQITRISLIIDEIQRIKSDEEDYFDNMPENLQSSMRADDSQDAIDSLDESISSLESAIENLEEIM